MRKILIINIDQGHRSAYSALIAALLLKKYPSVKISMVTSVENEFFNSTQLFDQITTIAVKNFFKRTRGLKSDEIELEMRKILNNVIRTEWDQVINLSANLLGAIFTCMLNSKSFLGPYAREELPELKYSNLSSYFLSSVPDENNNYLHFAFLYKDIIGVYYDEPIKAIWEDKSSAEVNKLFQDLLKKENRKKIILIDANMTSKSGASDLVFFKEIYDILKNDNLALPVFYSADIEQNKDMILELQSKVAGEVYFFTCHNKTQLSLVNNVSLIVTDDLHMKSLADLSQTPTVLIGKNKKLLLSDFSIVEKSHLVICKNNILGPAKVIAAIIDRMLKGTPVPQAFYSEAEIYSTQIHSSIPILTPLNLVNDQGGGAGDFARWWLCLRFMAHKKKIDLPMISVDKSKYLDAIKHERQSIWEVGPDFGRKYSQGEKFKGVLAIEAGNMRFLNSKFSSDLSEQSKEMKSIQMKMLDFLSGEEALLGS